MAQYVEIDIDQGADFVLDLGLKNDDGTPKNVSGYTFVSAIKKSYYSTTTTAYFNVVSTGASIGSIILSLTAAQTAAIKPGRYLFDIKQLDTDFKVERLAEGIVTISPQITS